MDIIRVISNDFIGPLGGYNNNEYKSWNKEIPHS